MRQQMVLGTFIFGLSRGFAYDTLDRGSSGGWVSLDIIAGKPKSSQVGQGLETLALGGKAARADGMARLDGAHSAGPAGAVAFGGRVGA